MYSQRSIAARSELGEGHRSPLGIEFYNTIPRKFPSDLRVDEYTPWVGGRIRCGSMNVAPRPPGQSAFAPENLRASRGVLQVHPQRQQASRVARATAYQVRVRDQSEKAIQVEMIHATTCNEPTILSRPKKPFDRGCHSEQPAIVPIARDEHQSNRQPARARQRE